VLDADDVLWITSERYLRQTPLADHAAASPREVTWYADPAGRTEIEELRRAGLTVNPADNNIQQGIGLFTARLRTAKLKVLATCRNLLTEAKLYRYPTAGERETLGENPIDAHNHALAALRYLIARVDYGKRPGRPTQQKTPPKPTPALDADDERY